MDDKDLQIIKVLHEEKNITHTAKRLFMSQPSLSDRLKKLENELGRTLFIRQPRGLVFTDHGERLYQYAQTTLDNYQQLKADLSSENTRISGRLLMGCSNIFANYHMPQLLSQFKDQYPDIDISMSSGYSQQQYKKLLSDSLHICISRGDHNWNECKHLIWREPLCVISQEPIELTSLPDAPYIHYTTDANLQEILEEWWYSHFNKPPRTTITVDSMDTAIRLAKENLGYTLLSQSCLQDAPHLHWEPLHTPKGEPILRDTWMYYRKCYENLGPVKAFVDFMKSQRTAQVLED